MQWDPLVYQYMILNTKNPWAIPLFTNKLIKLLFLLNAEVEQNLYKYKNLFIQFKLNFTFWEILNYHH